MKNIFAFTALFMLVISCKNENTEVKVIIDSNTQFLGHKGSGNCGTLGNIDLLENTKKSIMNSINKIDGSEFDIQLSADKTLWIFHDNDIIDCNGLVKQISLSSDSIIQEISNCKYSKQLITFRQFMEEINEFKLPSKTIVLDLKVTQNSDAIKLFDSKHDFHSFITNSIETNLPKKSKINVIAEVYEQDQYAFFKRNTKIETFLVINELGSDFEIRKKASSFSIPLENDFYSHLKNRNKTFGVWTANNVEQMLKAISYKPKYILSDNIPLSQFFKELKNKKASSKIIEKKEQKISVKDEYYTVKILGLSELNENFIVSFLTQHIKNKKGIVLTFSCVDQNRKCIYWISYPISSGNSIQEFIDVDFLKKNGGKELTINILNQSKSYFEMDGFVLKKTMLK